jgi:TetR/AcrR family transcriptional regulator, regulator of biofilm formation and stress response
MRTPISPTASQTSPAPPEVSSTPAGLPPTEANVAGMRERILRATMQLIADGGVAAVTNRRVAAAAGVSPGSLTYHFTSQAELLRESLLLYVQEETVRREDIARELARACPSVEQVAQAVEQLAASSADIPQQIAELELHLQAARDAELRDASRRCFQAHDKIAAAALGALGVAESERHAAKVVALMTGLAIRRLAEGSDDAQGTSEALLALGRGLSDTHA